MNHHQRLKTTETPTAVHAHQLALLKESPGLDVVVDPPFPPDFPPVFVEPLVLVLVELELFDFPPLDLDELLFDDDDLLLLFPFPDAFPDDDLLLLFELDFDELFAAKNSSNWNSSSSENNIFDSVECHDRITMKQAKANIVFVYIFCIKEFSNLRIKFKRYYIFRNFKNI